MFKLYRNADVFFNTTTGVNTLQLFRATVLARSGSCVKFSKRKQAVFFTIDHLLQETIVIETMTKQNLSPPSCWTLPCWSDSTCFSCCKKTPLDLFSTSKSNLHDENWNKTHFFSDLFQSDRVSSCLCMLFYKAKQRVATETTTNTPDEESRNRRAFLDIFRPEIPSSLSFFSHSTSLFRHFSFQFVVGKTTASWFAIKGSR